MFTNKLRQHLPPYRRRLLCEALEARTLLSSVALAQVAAGGSVQASTAAQQQTLADLPIAAQHAISSAIGQDQSAYRATSGGLGVTLANPANGFTAQLQSVALQVSAGSDTWDMSLVGLAYGGAMQSVGTAQTSTNGNRVDCNYRAIDEWYVNGPGGLEQGFTVASQPQSEASGSLTVELALGGDLTGTVNAAGDGLTLARPDGSAVLGYIGLTACDAKGKTLPASLEVHVGNGQQELLIHVNAFGAQGPITIDPFLQEAKLTASDGKASDYFGSSVAISGNTVVVGASGATVGGNADQGAAYVFTEPASGWADMTETAKLTASDGAAGDNFGFSVAISGNTVVVGASNARPRGAVYVFTEPASGWKNMTQTAKLTVNDSAPGWQGSLFGYSVAISGNTIVVGAQYAADPAVGDNPHGAAYVFTERASGWANVTQAAKLTASDGASHDRFGFSVSISGNTVVVGAVSAHIDWSTFSYGPGAAYVFTEPASGWTDMTETAKLTASDGAAGDGFGFSVSISGNTVVVGADGPGAAYVFTEPATGWTDMTETAKLTASDGAAGEGFGAWVSISGNTVVATGGGAAYVFTGSGSAWTQIAKLTASDGAAGDGFGAVSISGNTVVVGAGGATVGGNAQQGEAYVFATPLTPLTVTPADWTSAGLTLTLGGDGDLHVYTTGTTTDAVPPVAPASISSIDITSPSDTTADLTIDTTAGDPVPAGGLNYSGAGGLVKTGSGTVTLSGPNSYTGRTTVASGRLLINAASALPGGTSLTVAAGGTFVFDPSQSASSVTRAAPVTAKVVSSSAVMSALNAAHVVSMPSPPAPLPKGEGRLEPSPFTPVPKGEGRIAGDLAWLTQTPNNSGSSDQRRKKEVAILAWEAVFAEYF